MKRWLVVIGTTVGTAAVVWLAGAWVAGSYARKVDTALWPSGLGSLPDVERRYPDATANAAAMRLYALAKPLGIELRRDAHARADMMPLRRALTTYLRSEDETPPPLLGRFFDVHRAEIDALRDQLVAGPQPIWTMRIRDLGQAPLPNLLGQMDTARLLVADARDRARQDDDEAAWKDLHAAWQLARPMWQRPEMISQMIALAVSRAANNEAHRLGGPEPAWRAEMRAFDYAHAMLGAIQYDAWMQWTYARDKGSIASVIGSPLIRRMSDDVVDALHSEAVVLSRIDNEAFDAHAIGSSARDRIAGWNAFARARLTDGHARAWQRLRAYQRELR